MAVSAKKSQTILCFAIQIDDVDTVGGDILWRGQAYEVDRAASAIFSKQTFVPVLFASEHFTVFVRQGVCQREFPIAGIQECHALASGRDVAAEGVVQVESCKAAAAIGFGFASFVKIGISH